MAVGASGCGGLDFSLSEMKSMIEGKEQSEWRQTLLLYSCSYNPNKSALADLYPYYEQCRKVSSEDAHKAGVARLEAIIKSRF